MTGWFLRLFFRSDPVVPGLDGFDGLSKCLLQVPFADGPEEDAENSSLEVLAVAHYDDVHIGRAVGLPRECIGVAGATSPKVGISSCENDAGGIGPVVVQSFPDTA